MQQILYFCNQFLQFLILTLQSYYYMDSYTERSLIYLCSCTQVLNICTYSCTDDKIKWPDDGQAHILLLDGGRMQSFSIRRVQTSKGIQIFAWNGRAYNYISCFRTASESTLNFYSLTACTHSSTCMSTKAVPILHFSTTQASVHKLL